MARAERTPWTEAFAAISAGDAKAFRKALQRHPALLSDPCAVYEMISDAASENAIDILEVLLAFGVDLNTPEDAQNPEGPIEKACSSGAVAGVRWLLDHGAQINFRVDGCERCFALSSAAMRGHLELVKLLVARGASVNATWAGRNALSLSRQRGYHEVENYLISVGASMPTELDSIL